MAPPWRPLRWYPAVAGEYPTLKARVMFNPRSLECRLVVTSDLGAYWSCPALHPLPTWGTWKMEHEVVAQFIRKAVEQTERKQARLAGEVATWAAGHPALWEYLTVDCFEDGAPRETSMMLMFVEDGRFKMALQDREEGRSLWVTADSLSDALRAMEAALRAGNADWRQMRTPQKKTGRK